MSELEKQVKDLTADIESRKGKLQLSMTNSRKLQQDFENLRKSYLELEAKGSGQSKETGASSEEHADDSTMKALKEELEAAKNAVQKQKDEVMVFKKKYVQANRSIRAERERADTFKAKLKLAGDKLTFQNEELENLKVDQNGSSERLMTHSQPAKGPETSQSQEPAKVSDTKAATRVQEQQSPGNRRKTRLSARRQTLTKEETSSVVETTQMAASTSDAVAPSKEEKTAVSETNSSSEDGGSAAEKNLLESKSPSPGRRVTRLSKRRYSKDPTADLSQIAEEAEVGTKRSLRHPSGSQEVKRAKSDVPVSEDESSSQPSEFLIRCNLIIHGQRFTLFYDSIQSLILISFYQIY